MTRADMIGPRPLRPAANPPLAIDSQVHYRGEHSAPMSRSGMVGSVMPGCRPAPPPPRPQPALVIRDDLSKSLFSDDSMIKAHSEILSRLRSMVGRAPHDSHLGSPKPRAGRKSGGTDVMSSGEFRGSDFSPSGAPPIDVSTPKHEHARLQAKQVHLQDLMTHHQNAGHHPDHPDVRGHAEALESVTSKIKNLEAAGHTSGPEHHGDWMSHLVANPKSEHAGGNTDATLSAHFAMLRPEKQQQRKEMGVSTVRRHLPRTKEVPATRATASPSSEKETRVMPKPDAPTRSVSTGGPQLSLMRSMRALLDMAKSKEKGDNWISEKIRLLMHEGKPQKQAIAIAHSMAGRSQVKKSSPPLIVTA